MGFWEQYNERKGFWGKIRFLIFGTWEDWGLEILWYDRAFFYLLISAGSFIYYHNLPIDANDVFLFIVGFVGWMYGRATIKMAHETLRLASLAELKNKETLKEWERPQILDEVQLVISPLLETCIGIIKNINESNYSWYYDYGGDSDLDLYTIHQLTNFYFSEKTAEKDVYQKYPELKKKIELYNSNIPKLEEKFTILIKDIRTPDFIEMCKKRAFAFNKTKENSYKIQQGQLSSIDLPILHWIVENKTSVKKNRDSNEPVTDFWNETSELFLKIREKGGINEILIDIDKFIIGITKEIISIRDQLVEIREKYRTEFNLTEDELIAINPMDRRTRGFL